MLTHYAEECRAAGHRPATIRLRISYLSRVPNLETATRADLDELESLAGEQFAASDVGGQ